LNKKYFSPTSILAFLVDAGISLTGIPKEVIAMNAASVTISAGISPFPTTGESMPPRKKNDHDDEAEKRGRGRPKVENPKGRSIGTRLEGDLQDAWDEFMADCDPPTTDASAVRAAIRFYLTHKGYPRKKPRPSQE
jgi:hypothetical protein